MTESMIDLAGLIAKSEDADFLRELIQDAAQRLMDIEVSELCGAGHGQRTPQRQNQRNRCPGRRLQSNLPRGGATASAGGTRGRAVSA